MCIITLCGQACDIVNFCNVNCLWQSSSVGGKDLNLAQTDVRKKLV